MPTFTHGKNAKFYLVDSGATERDISNVLTTIDFPRTADTAEVSALGDGAKAYIAGLRDATFNLGGSRDTTVEGYIDGVLGTLTTFSYLPEGSATGRIKYSGTVIVTQYQPTSAINDANKFTGAAQVSGSVTRTVL